MDLEVEIMNLRKEFGCYISVPDCLYILSKIV